MASALFRLAPSSNCPQVEVTLFAQLPPGRSKAVEGLRSPPRRPRCWGIAFRSVEARSSPPSNLAHLIPRQCRFDFSQIEAGQPRAEPQPRDFLFLGPFVD